MPGHSHSHSHGNHCGCDDDEHVVPGEGQEDYLYDKIDRDHVEAFNEAVAGSGKLVIKPWDQRNDETQCLESDADEQLILRVPFTGSVKLRTIIIKGEGGEQCPLTMKVFVNLDAVTFDDVQEKKPVQTIELVQSRTPVEYTVRAAKFPSVQSITLFFETNYGAETSKVYYVGFKGEFQKMTRQVVGIVYEAQANPADHVKIPGTDTANAHLGGGY